MFRSMTLLFLLGNYHVYTILMRLVYCVNILATKIATSSLRLLILIKSRKNALSVTKQEIKIANCTKLINEKNIKKSIPKISINRSLSFFSINKNYSQIYTFLLLN